MAHGVTVAQAPLERLVKVRILVGQFGDRCEKPAGQAARTSHSTIYIGGCRHRLIVEHVGFETHLNYRKSMGEIANGVRQRASAFIRLVEERGPPLIVVNKTMSGGPFSKNVLI